MKSIEETLLDRLEAKFGSRPQLSDGLAFLGIDSVGMAELTFELEDQFNVRVGDDIIHVDTVQDLANYIRERQAVQHE